MNMKKDGTTGMPAEAVAVQNRTLLHTDDSTMPVTQAAGSQSKIIKPFGDGEEAKPEKKFPSFVEMNEKGGWRVCPPLLAESFSEQYPYIMVRQDGRADPELYLYRNGVYEPSTDFVIKGILKKSIKDFDVKAIRMRDINEAFNLIRAEEAFVEESMLDSNERLINFKNGMLRFSEDSLELEPHSPEHYSTIQLDCEWKEEPTPFFDSYFETLTDGDKAEQEVLLQVLGTTVSNVYGWRFKKALFMVGPGNSGKSVLRNLADKILGPRHTMAVDLNELESRFGTGTIYGTRLIGTADMSCRPVRELKTLKRITGGDDLQAEHKGKQAFQMRYKGVAWFCCNELPKFQGDTGDWVYDRILIVHCDNVIPVEEQDKTLLDKLYAERNGIVYKAVKALQRAISNGMVYTEPDSAAEYRRAYKVENNSAMSFFEECCCEKAVDDFRNEVTISVFYNAYKAWCRENGVRAKTRKELQDAIANAMGVLPDELKVHRQHGYVFKYLTLTPEAMECYTKRQ